MGPMQMLLAGGGAPGIINDDLPAGASLNTSATWQLNNDGTYTISTDQSGDWVSPSNSTIAAFYEVRVDVTSGSFSSGTTGSWLALSTTRGWTRQPPGSTGENIVTFTVSIREAATGLVRSVQEGVTLTAATLI